MTVTATSPVARFAYTAIGDYPFLFQIFKETDLRLVMTDAAGLVTVLQYGPTLDYTVTIDASGIGGICHLTHAVVGGTLEIRRILELTQDTVWPNNGPFSPKLLEYDLDYAMMAIQQLDVITTEGSGTSTWRGDWAPSTVYSLNDNVIDSLTGDYYVCIVDHVSGSAIIDDLADWHVIMDISGVKALADAAEAAAAAALVSETNAASSEANASSSEANAASSEANASTSESNASSSAANALVSEGNAATSETASYNWSQYPEDSPVPEGIGSEYSAYHWAKKAEVGAGGGVLSIQPGDGIAVDSTDASSPIVTNTGARSIVAGTAIDIDNTDPFNPVVTNAGARSIVAGVAIAVDNTDPFNPIVTNTGARSIVAGAAIDIDNTDPFNPVVTNTGARSIVAGAAIDIDNTDPFNPVVTNAGVQAVVAGDGIIVNEANPVSPVVGLSAVIPTAVDVSTSYDWASGISTTKIVPYNTILSDDNGEFSGYKFTAKRSGMYNFHANFYMTADTDAGALNIYFHVYNAAGASVRNILVKRLVGAKEQESFSCNMAMKVQAGHYFQVEAYSAGYSQVFYGTSLSYCTLGITRGV